MEEGATGAEELHLDTSVSRGRRPASSTGAGISENRAGRAGGDQGPGSLEVCVAIRVDMDIVTARQRGRRLATQLGLSPGTATAVAAAVSELARNILLYAGGGEISMRPENNRSGGGVTIIARDEGPGIRDLSMALREGYSTSMGLGLGLPGVKRLVDDFEIVSELGKGTTVIVTKWTFGR